MKDFFQQSKPLKLKCKLTSISFFCKVCLVHDPRVSHPYGRLYTVEYLGNIVGGQKTLYNNQPIRVLKQAVYDSIAADEVTTFFLIFVE
jgi:aminopeptidase C